MASSRIPRIALDDVGAIAASRTPGPLGRNDQGDPSRLPQKGDTPGPLGMNDHGAPKSTPSKKYLEELRLGRLSSPKFVPSKMTISQDGLRFIWREEYVKGISERLHWPGGASGVTLGAGYDMKCRSQARIKEDLTGAGMTAEKAEKVAKAAGLSSDAAKKFTRENRKLVELDEAMATALLRLIVKDYEDPVKRMIRIPLRQHEFDALVSFAYNPGGRFRSVANLINQGKVLDAVIKISGATTSGGIILMGLVHRRSHEIDLYLNGNYRK